MTRAHWDADEAAADLPSPASLPHLAAFDKMAPVSRFPLPFFRRARALLGWVALMALLALPAGAASTLQFPGDDPAFSVELPDGWTAKLDKDGLNLFPNDESMLVLFSRVGEMEPEAAALKFVDGIKNGGQFKDAAVAEDRGGELNGMPMHSVELVGKDADNDNIVVTVIAFAPVTESFTLFSYAAPESEKKNDKAIATIVRSLKKVARKPKPVGEPEPAPAPEVIAPNTPGMAAPGAATPDAPGSPAPVLPPAPDAPRPEPQPSLVPGTPFPSAPPVPSVQDTAPPR